MLLLFLLMSFMISPCLAQKNIQIQHSSHLGGFSGLSFFKGHFYTVTDRTSKRKKTTPAILQLTKSLTGVKNIIQLDLEKHKSQPYHIDPEGLAIDSSGDFWIAEELGPSLLHFNSEGKLKQRYLPIDSPSEGRKIFPKYLNSIDRNRGFESLSSLNNFLYFMLQTSNVKNSTANTIFILDINTNKLSYYAYPMDHPKAKIAAIKALSTSALLILERISKKQYNIYQVDLPTPSSEKEKRSLKLKKALYLVIKSPTKTKYEGMEFQQGHIYLLEDNDYRTNTTGQKRKEASSSIMSSFKAPST